MTTCPANCAHTFVASLHVLPRSEPLMRSSLTLIGFWEVSSGNWARSLTVKGGLLARTAKYELADNSIPVGNLMRRVVQL